MSLFSDLTTIVERGDIRALQQFFTDCSQDDLRARRAALLGVDAQKNSLLHLAAIKGDVNMLNALLAMKGVDVFLLEENADAKTPCALAEENAQQDAVAFLSTRQQWQQRFAGFGKVNVGHELQLLEEGVEVAKRASDKDIVLVLGDTGVGKSTLLNYLDGISYDIQGDYGHRINAVARPGQSAERFKTSAAHVSETLFPQLETIRSQNARASFDVADLAGLEGNRDRETELAGMMGIHMLSQSARSVKGAVVVLDMQRLVTGRENLTQAIETIVQVLNGNVSPDRLSSLQFVINKVPPAISGSEFIDTLVRPLIEHYTTREDLTMRDLGVLEVLMFMAAHQDHITIARADDAGQTREELFAAMSRFTGLEKDTLDLLSLDDNQQQFNDLLNFMALEFTQRMQMLDDLLPQELEAAEASLGEANANVARWQRDIAENEQRIQDQPSQAAIEQVIRGKQGEIAAIDARYAVVEADVAQRRAQIAANLALMEELDSDELVPSSSSHSFMHTAEYILHDTGEPVDGGKAVEAGEAVGAIVGGIVGEGNPLAVAAGKMLGGAVGSFISGSKTKKVMLPKPGQGEYTFSHDGSIITGDIADLDLQTQGEGLSFHSKQVSGNRYSIKLRYPYSQQFSATVVPMIAKRDLPDNKSKMQILQSNNQASEQRIDILAAEMRQLEQQKATLQGEVRALQTDTVDAAGRVAHWQQENATRVAYIRNERQTVAALTQTITQCRESRATIQREITTNVSLFRAVASVAAVLGIDKTTDLVTSFTEGVSKFEREYLRRPASARGAGLFAASRRPESAASAAATARQTVSVANP